ncbi:MAG TPA: hypothetical protein VFH85_07660 [Gammaproteobacteria bacterium]|nr:hypothetical protein [Gammaproteobacteria bacterium]
MKTRDVVTEQWRMPTVPEGDTVLFNEPGRVLDRKTDGGNTDVCYSAHCFMVTAGKYGPAMLRVRHGAGEESWRIGWACDPIMEALGMLDSNARFFMLHSMMRAHHESAERTAARVGGKYLQAFADGRLKKRKLRGRNEIKVWIEGAQS